MSKIVFRAYSRKACDKIEKITGIRTTCHMIEKRSNKSPKFIKTFVADRNM